MSEQVRVSPSILAADLLNLGCELQSVANADFIHYDVMGTAVSSLDAIIDYLDMVLVMSVNPGFSGQRFIEHTYTQLNKLTNLCRSHSVRPLVEIDGGITPKNAAQVVAAGANVLVGGSGVFGAPDHARAVEEMRAAGVRGLAMR